MQARSGAAAALVTTDVKKLELLVDSGEINETKFF
jgi:hypothetical protein